MAIAADTLLEEARCLGCNSEASDASLLKLGLWQRMVTGVEEAVASFVARSGITSAAQIAAVTTLVANAMAHGWWSKSDLIYPYVGGTAGAHAQNLKSSNFAITWNGTVTHNSNGITGDGATGYGDTGYIPSSSGQMLLNSTHGGFYRRTQGGFGVYFGVADGTQQLASTRFGANLRAAVNDNNIFDGVGGGAVLAWNLVSRLSTATKSIFYGSTNQSVAQASIGIPIGNLFVLALNGGGGIPGNFQSANLAGLTAGSGITFAMYQNMAADWQAFNTSLGRQV